MELHWHHPELFRAQDRAQTEQRLRELARDHDDLIDVRISARPSTHHRHGDQEVHIICEVRGKEIVAARTRADLGLALNEALDAFEREVDRKRDRRRQQRRGRSGPPPDAASA
jgi:ribosomal subunit interface protein